MSRIFRVMIMAVAIWGALTSVAHAVVSPVAGSEQALLAKQGYKRWEWLQSTCADCDMTIVTKSPDLNTKEVQSFVAAISQHKADLIRLYGINGQEYNLLAKMAIGILGRESKFFESRRYAVKEAFPWLVSLAKRARGGNVNSNSRGPTQIKVVPKQIAEVYGVTSENIYLPENAALATMGFLADALKELKSRIAVNKLGYITPENYVDYLPYLYFGSKRTLLNGSAHPEKSFYIREMKLHMEGVELYERPEKAQISRPAMVPPPAVGTTLR